MKREQIGQGLVEYALILVLVAIVVIAVMRILGPKIGATFSTINNCLPDTGAECSDGDGGFTGSGSTAGFVANEPAYSDEDIEDAREKIEVLAEAVALQDEGIDETINLSQEATEEGLQVMSEDADVAAIQAAIEAGDYEAAAAAMADLISGGTQVPVEIILLIATKTMPLYGQICGHLNDAVVPPQLYDDALAALVALNPNHPAIPLLQEVWDQVQQRNQVIQETRDGIGSETGVLISSLADSGDEDLITLALQFEAQTAACDGDVITVLIDIKPGSDPNCFNNNGHGVIPAAILTTDAFDATTVDPFTVTLDGAATQVKGKSGNAGALEDVDFDGDLDLVLQIEDVDGTYQVGDTVATLTGKTFGDDSIEGKDTICIVP